MTIADLEQTAFGEPLTPLERALAGLVAALGAIGPAGLVAAAALLGYVLLAAP